MGTVRISGRKNAVLKLIAATLLTTGTVTLRRVPRIRDVEVMLEILVALGATVEWVGDDVLTICTAGVTSHSVPTELGRKLRASMVFVGPLVARFGKASFPHPGGCVIGKRSIGPHLTALEGLGCIISFDGDRYEVVVPNALAGDLIYLREKSVTGTENLLMAACGCATPVRLWNCAEETHVRNLAELLQQLGYQVAGAGTSQMVVSGGDLSTRDADIAVIPDEIEIGTFLAAALATKGTVTLEGTGNPEDMLPITTKLHDFGAKLTITEDSITAHPSDLVATNMQTNPWPGFPPDLQSPFLVLATQATGISHVHDWMYEGRLNFAELLAKMGANVVLCDPHRAIITGPIPLKRSTLISPDLRAGAAYVIAALAAEGTSVVEHAELIDRGYDRFEERLRSLGATIERQTTTVDVL
jgi:UDP-N-acetylglucosamine 1-carboxyvinyltransferase